MRLLIVIAIVYFSYLSSRASVEYRLSEATSGLPWLVGVNLSAASFAPDKIPGRYGTDFVYPPVSDLDYFAAAGANVFRFPILWERLQPKLFETFNAEEMGRLNYIVDAASQKNAFIIIDIHNYGRYRDISIQDDPSVDQAFGDLWYRLALVFAGRQFVLFGLMNEPQIGSAEVWRRSVQHAIDEIRRSGASNVILVSGVKWDGVENFVRDNGVLDELHDPAHAILFEAHQYFDSDTSGTHAECVRPDLVAQRFTSFTDWLRQTGNRGFLGEFGGSERAECLMALDNVLSFLGSNKDVWAGWTYWAAGPAWGDNMLSVEPRGDVDRPQMTVLRRYLEGNAHSAGPR